MGASALMSEARPLGIYFTLQVLKPFANTNMKIERINNQRNCCHVGNFTAYEIKAKQKKTARNELS